MNPYENAEEIVHAQLDDSTVERPQKPAAGFLEQLLSPQSLQWMMGCGGGLLMLGFVIWLWSVGIFENPLIVASAVGAATLGTIAGGIAMVRLTRYQLAGKWLTLLGALAMPLNLWLYDVQGLVTLADGGHLWIPAAVCCFIYGMVARTLKDSTFVYTLVGGVVMTGMLFLADMTIGRFWALIPQATFLLSIGWISVFAERFFEDNDGEFSRKKFGLAFHRSGILVVVSGLLLLLGGNVTSMFGSFLDWYGWNTIALSQTDKLWACGLIAVSAFGFAGQGFLQKYRIYNLVAAALLTWIVPLTLNIFAVEVTTTTVAIFLATLTIVLNLAVAIFGGKFAGNEQRSGIAQFSAIEKGSRIVISLLSVLSAAQFITFLMSASPILLGQFGLPVAAQLLLTAIAALTYAWNCMYRGNCMGCASDSAETGKIFFGVGSALTVMSIWSVGLLRVPVPVELLTMGSAIVPLTVALSRFVAKGKLGKNAVEVTASIGASVHLGIFAATYINKLVLLPHIHLAWTVCLLCCSVVYLLVSGSKATGINRITGYTAATAGFAVAGNWAGFDFGYCVVLAPMILGTIIKITDSILLQGKTSEGEYVPTQLATAGNLFVLASGGAGFLLAMSRWIEGATSGSLMLVMLTLMACTAITSVLTKNQTWRNTFRALIIAIAGSCICVFDGWLDIDGWHRAELCCLLGGVFLVAMGHVAWTREKAGTHDETATICLLIGSFLLALPLMIGLLSYRLAENGDVAWRQFHEISTIAVGLVLFGSGMLCRLRSTTLAGGSLLIVYLASVATLIRWPSQLQNVSVLMMVGGGLFFGSALLMSIYRDRLVSLPKRIRNGDGLYRVLKWR